MKTISLSRSASCLSLAIAMAVVANVASAQPAVKKMQAADPARWTQVDVTPAQKLSTARKEAVNAQQQSLEDCKSLPSARFAECSAEAHTNYRNDMTDIRNRFGV